MSKSPAPPVARASDKPAARSHLNPINFLNRDSFQPDEAKFDRNGRYIEPKPAPNPRRARPRRGG